MMKEENYNEEYDKKFTVKKDEENFLKTYNDLKFSFKHLIIFIYKK